MEDPQPCFDPSKDDMSVNGDGDPMETDNTATRAPSTAHDSATASTSTPSGPTPLASQRSSASLALSAPNEITIDSTDTDASLSSDSVEVISGVSSDEEQSGGINGFSAGPHPFTTPSRSARPHRGVPSMLFSSPPKAAAGELDLAAVPPDYPLPRPPFAFDVLNHAPSRHPGSPPSWQYLRDMTSEERHEHQRREDERKKRERDQRQLREEWEWEWVRCATTSPGTPAKGKEQKDFHSASFFPYAHLPGLGYMEGVCAVIGGTEVRLMQISTVPPSRTVVQEVATPYRRPNVHQIHPDHEEYFTCAWSVNISTHPYTPMLAVAGRGRLVEVFLVGRRAGGKWILHHDRTITGHGGPIFDLAFHPSHPHMLASCSEDKTIRLWDVTVSWGSNAAVAKQTPSHPASITARERPRVEGELLAVLAEGGHEKAVLSCDFRAVQPLLVSSGADGFIKVWRLPPNIFSATPHWPSAPLYRPPTSPPPPSNAPVLGPPIFSSYAVHPGQWPDQVSFLSASSCTILSKAAVSHDSSRFSPRTSVKIWVPTILDVLPDAKAEKRRAEVERSRSEASTADPCQVPRQTDERPPLPIDARSESGFRVMYEAILEGQNCVGDTVGIYRRPPTLETGRGPADVFFVVPTSTRMPLFEGMDGRHGEPALYFFRPFAPPEAPVSADSPSESQRSASIGGSGDKRTASKESVDQIAKTLFPPDRDRLAHDFTPRLLPSAVTDIFTLSQQQSNAPLPQIHFRCIAVQPNGAASIVGVGDGGLVSVWKRQRRVK
ncbi:hypothetical protein NBRC10512_003277 [Rhodotorula toruloides]|uniref:RHTO0S24e01420g1_1 n=2 Tax=Rhodotorula toruloides TaxID=5286 RepID=A0A061BMM1_RHOTO|nr:polycomb protein EED [Rhodotorula toruloides NP11]EMS19317.1 polycomb protein EED [Rhodotorula toruloides NP11]CDR49234.1 RHTO0S24e01420g1_1 [Rhodotorula toruloides]